MSELEHWGESGPPAGVTELLRAARAEDPPASLVERSLALAALASAGTLANVAAHAASLSGAAGSTAAGASAKGLTAVSLLQWGAAGVVAGSVCMAGIGITQRFIEPPPPALARSAIERPESSASQHLASAPASAQPATAPERADANEHPTEPRSLPTAAPSISARNRDRSLAEALALLQGARAAVDASAPERALSLLAEHERRFGSTAILAPEARYLRLQALVLGQRSVEARAVAREILKHDPQGPHAARAQALLSEHKE